MDKFDVSTMAPDKIINALAPLVHPRNADKWQALRTYGNGFGILIPGCATREEVDVLQRCAGVMVYVADAYDKVKVHPTGSIAPNQTRLITGLSDPDQGQALGKMRDRVKAALLEAFKRRDGNSAPNELSDTMLNTLPMEFAHRVELPSPARRSAGR